MSIHFISGKPGGGKSLYGLKLIIEELIYGLRPIVTNVPINLARLNEYFQEKYPHAYHRFFLANGSGLDMLPHIRDRINILSDDDLGKFFTFRGYGVRLASVTNQQWKEGVRPSYAAVVDAGVLYVLDEIHIAFNSRAWADTGQEVLYYLSQHRKLGDDVVCITQAIGNVDKQFRSVAQDYTYIRNLSKQRAGIFKLPKMFVRTTYAQPATGNSQSLESGTFFLDVTGLASCYDTAKGVGIHGRSGGDQHERRKGVHWAVAVIAVPLLVFLLIHYLPRFLVHHMNALPPRVAAPVFAPVPVAAAPVVSIFKPAMPVREVTSSLPVADEIVCSGYYIAGKDVVVMLSDGSTYDSRDGEIDRITPKYVIVEGKSYRMAKPKRVPDSVPAALYSARVPDSVASSPAPSADAIADADLLRQLQLLVAQQNEQLASRPAQIQVAPAIGGGAVPPPISGLH